MTTLFRRSRRTAFCFHFVDTVNSAAHFFDGLVDFLEADILSFNHHDNAFGVFVDFFHPQVHPVYWIEVRQGLGELQRAGLMRFQYIQKNAFDDGHFLIAPQQNYKINDDTIGKSPRVRKTRATNCNPISRLTRGIVPILL